MLCRARCLRLAAPHRIKSSSRFLCAAPPPSPKDAKKESIQKDESPPTKDDSLQLSSEAKLQLSILLGSSFVIQAAVGMIIPVLPLFAQDVGLGSSGVGLIVAMPAAAKLALNLPVGHLVDTVGRRKPLVYGCVIDGVGSLLTAASSNLTQMAPARLLVGAGSSLGSTAGGAYLMDVVAQYPQHVGKLLGTAHAVGALGFAAGPMLGGLLAERGGAALPFVLIGSVLIASGPVFSLLPETKPPSAPAAAASNGGARLGDALSSAVDSFRVLLKDERQVALCFMTFHLLAGWSVSLTTIPLHATATWGATPGQLGQIYSVVTLCGLLSAPIAGYLTDRIGRRPLVACGGLATALSIACFPLVGQNEAAYYGLMGVWALGETFMMTATTALAADVTAPEQRGAATSLRAQVGDLTFMVMPVMLGLIATSHSHAAAFGVTSVCGLGATAAFWRLTTSSKVR